MPFREGEDNAEAKAEDVRKHTSSLVQSDIAEETVANKSNTTTRAKEEQKSNCKWYVQSSQSFVTEQIMVYTSVTA